MRRTTEYDALGAARALSRPCRRACVQLLVHRQVVGLAVAGDSALAVWPRSNQAFLLELAGRCPDMAFTHSIGLTSSVGRVSAGFDRVIVRLPANRSPNRVGCTIRTIRPINAQVIKESKSDLGEGEITERDPSIPDEPTQ